MPVTVRDKAGRPPDLDLYTRALEDEWDVPNEVKADTIARLHAVVNYLNDPRAVVRAGNALIRATEANHKGREVALKVRERFKPPSSMPFMEPVRKYDPEGLTNDQSSGQAEETA